jgi:hypothetical protein
MCIFTAYLCQDCGTFRVKVESERGDSFTVRFGLTRREHLEAAARYMEEGGRD